MSDPSSDRAPAAHSVATLADNVGSIPAAIESAITAPLLPLPNAALAARTWVTTGIGMSEGPARALAACLRTMADRVASFVPISSFLARETAPRGETLVIFSQGLSPNAASALVHSNGFAHRVLVTGCSPSDHPAIYQFARSAGTLWTLPPRDEHGLYLRVVGPSIALVAALRIAREAAQANRCNADALSSALERAPAAFRRGLARAQTAALDHSFSISADAAFVTAPAIDSELLHGVRWTWLEGLGPREPSLWDVLQVAHGPFQNFAAREIVLIGLLRDDADRPLFDRLASMLDTRRHRLILCAADERCPAAGFAFQAFVDALVLATLHASPRDLLRLPEHGRDAALYELGARTDPAR